MITFRHHTIDNWSWHPRVHRSQQWWFLCALNNFRTHIWLSSPLFRRRLAIHCIDLPTENLVVLLRSCCLIVSYCFGATFNLIVGMWKDFLVSRLDLLWGWNHPIDSRPHIRITGSNSLLRLGLHNQYLILMNRWEKWAQFSVTRILIPIFWRHLDLRPRLRFTSFTVQREILLQLLLSSHVLLPILLAAYCRFHITQCLQHVLLKHCVILENSYLPYSLCWFCRPPSFVNCG